MVANAGRRTLLGSVTVVPDNGSPRSVPIRVTASGSTSVRLADVVTADNASALVELDGGQVVAELVTQGPLGDSVTPCASSASDSWYFAEGATTRDANEVLMVFNPFPEDALADFSFSTETGRVVPQALAGLVVKGRGMVAVPVGDNVRRRAAVSTIVKSRVGRLVVARLQTFDGTGDVPRSGVSLALGAPVPRPVWYFPEGYAGDGVTERIQIYNPSSREARVAIDMLLDQGEADPVELTVPAVSRVTFTVNDEPRVPPNVGHAAVVRATNGVAVVAERTVDAVPPATGTGFAVTLGASATASLGVRRGRARSRGRGMGHRVEPRTPAGDGGRHRVDGRHARAGAGATGITCAGARAAGDPPGGPHLPSRALRGRGRNRAGGRGA